MNFPSIKDELAGKSLDDIFMTKQDEIIALDIDIRRSETRNTDIKNKIKDMIELLNKIVSYSE